MHFSPHMRFFKILLLVGIIALQFPLFAQIVPSWDRDYGGSIWEELNSAEETSDGGFILAGFSSSSANDGDVTQANQGGGDYWIVKTDGDGNVLWDARYGGSELDRCNSIQQTSDGGYILGGTSASSTSGDKSGVNRGIEDYWVLKTDANGLIEWEQTYGGDNIDFLTSVIQTTDGGYLLGGRSMSGISGEKSEPNLGHFDHWYIKIDALGVIEWEKTLGGDDEERLNVVQEAADGDFLLGGSSSSDVGNDIGLPLLGVKDFWFLKVSALDGSIIWERRYGGTDEDELISFEQTSDGGFILVGGSRSNSSVWKSENARGVVDMWAIKTDVDGNKEWDATFGGSNLDNCYSVKENTAGYYLMGGFSGSGAEDDKSEPNIGGWDYWLVYLDQDGNKQWDKTFGGDANDVMFNLFQTSEGGYILAGNSSSDVSGDKTDPTKGLNDFWMIKTVCDVSVDFADTIVCPLQSVALDAFNGSNCPGCVWDWSDIGIGDSIRTILPPGSMSVSVTLTDQVGCQRSDDINITVLPAPTVELGADPVVCAGESAVLNAGNPGLDFSWSTGSMAPTIAVDTAGIYYVTVTDANGCIDIDSSTLILNPLPEVDLGDDYPVCLNVASAFNAGNPGTGISYEWSPSNTNDQVVSYAFDMPTTVSVTVTDNNNCSAADTLQITEIYESPNAINIATTCDPDNNFFQVTFDLVGGDPATYQVTTAGGGAIGTLTGNSFVSDPIPIGTFYSLFLRDGRACPPTNVNGVYDCACTSSAGDLVLNTFDVCGGEHVGVLLSGVDLDPNDTIEYVLHDGDSQTIGTVLLSQNQPVFTYNSNLTYGTTYYISALVGNDNGMGQVNMVDGCLSISDGVAVTFYEAPEAIIVAQTATEISCAEPTLVLSAAAAQPFGMLDFLWTSMNGGNITSPTNDLSIELDAAGTYILWVTDQVSGCQDTTHFEITVTNDLPIAIIETPSLLTCMDSIVQLNASNSSQGTAFSYLWEGGAITGETILNPSVMDAGVYQLTVTNEDNGCTQATSVTVIENQIEPVVDLGDFAFVDCDSDVALLDPFIGISTSNYSINWFAPEGNVFNSSDLTVEVSEAGVYRLEILNLETGCLGMDDVIVSTDPNGPRDALFEMTMPNCFGESNGSIRIDSVIGGLSPYEYAWDNTDFFSSDVDQINRLEAGEYDLTIRDANGCEWSTNIFLSQPQELLVNLGDNLALELGDSVRLTGFVNQQIDTLFWKPGTYLSCSDCLDPVVTPLNEVTYELTVVDTNNCTATDMITVFLNKERNVYIPTGFSPNGDGRNDHFRVYTGKGVEQVNYMRVFNRWGALVYENQRIQNGVSFWGWDGTFRGQSATDGVYVFVVEVLFTDGFVKQYQGDVTVLR